ncbi:TerC family protein [Paenibacillus hexagrammi]|uniref:TerC family protein n=1 Tax=Paenibacillus hexagrammi TaxID=2908839 RepID=A0ABY3SI37_9BACL|nr:TerC family protein [Paenibacillus sp. YPD9-1]UJF33438.1 TerC family protein [Paenibacillus sp. YPD9-1]
MELELLVVGLLKIILINIVLSGDNAVVIALACRSLPGEQQKKAIFFGSLGAIILRVLLTFAAVWLLQVPFVQVLGGLLLIWIALKLMKNDEQEEQLSSGRNLMGAIKTILVADLVMSLDNVLAIAGAAGGNYLLIVLGLAISIPLIIFGSKLLMSLMNRFPVIIMLGVGLLGYTAGEMILGDHAVASRLEALPSAVHYSISIILAIAVIVVGKVLSRNRGKEPAQPDWG